MRECALYLGVDVEVLARGKLSQFQFTQPCRSDSSSFLEWAFCSAHRYVGLIDAACVMGASPAFHAGLPSSYLDQIFLLHVCNLLAGLLTWCY